MAVFKPKTSPVGPQGACETCRNAEKCIYTYVYTSRVESVVFEVLADSTRRRIVETLGAGERAAPAPVEDPGLRQTGGSRPPPPLPEAGVARVRAGGDTEPHSLLEG